MGKVLKLVNQKNMESLENEVKRQKLIKIRDKIEYDLHHVSINENDELAVSLASGRYSAMKLAKLIGKDEAILFFKDCIDTSLSN